MQVERTSPHLTLRPSEPCDLVVATVAKGGQFSRRQWPAACPLQRLLPGADRLGVDRLARQKALQVVAQLECCCITPPRAFFEAFVNDRLEVRRNSGMVLSQPLGLFALDLHHQLERRHLLRRPE